MSDVTHLVRKWMAERARQNPTHRPQSTSSAPPPPPYTQAISEPEDEDEDSDSEENDAIPAKNHLPQTAIMAPTPQPLKLTINAAHSIQGSNNLVPTSVSPLADAARFGQLLMLSMNQLQAARPCCLAGGGGGSLELTINCGVTVVGDRNVIGHVGLKPKAGGVGGALPMSSPPTMATGAVAGAKRKSEEMEVESGTEQPTKKVAKEESVTA